MAHNVSEHVSEVWTENRALWKEVYEREKNIIIFTQFNQNSEITAQEQSRRKELLSVISSHL